MVKKPRPVRAGKKPKQVKNFMRLFVGSNHRPRKGKWHGKYTKLPFCKFLAELFHQNELADKDAKLTNDDLEACILKEFPDKPGILDGFKSGRRSINYHRDLYNRGRYTNYEPPPKISYRYDSLGQAVDLRTGTRVLTLDERRLHATRYGGIHAQLLHNVPQKGQVYRGHSKPDEPVSAKP